jgi:hypothetical protein
MATYEEIVERLSEENEEAQLYNGYEDALIGIARRFHGPSVALYDREHCIRILVERDGMSEEEADEFFEFNTQGCWSGEGTPVFATLFKREGKDDGHTGTETD